MNKETKIKKASFPHMGNYFVAFQPLAEMLGDKVITAPPITKKTINLGFKHGPEAACIPFKYNLGNYIEALDLGANVLIQSGGGCRMGYYGEVQAEILKKMGYDFEFVKFNNNFNSLAIVKIFKKFSPHLSYYRIVKKIALAYHRLRVIDQIESYVRKNIGFEAEDGCFDKLIKRFLNDLGKTRTKAEARKVLLQYEKQVREVKLNKPEHPLRVGIVGELYVLMEPFSNFYLEKELAKKNIEVHRFVTVSTILHDIFSFGANIRKHIKQAQPYLQHHIGAHGTESVAISHELIKKGFDGLIHIKPFACMPEVNAMSALNKMSKDYKFPIIYFSFDSQTSETGIKTRLEAFYDMLIMKKKKNV